MIQKLSKKIQRNDVYVLREDLIPFSFGGNKIRIAQEYIQDAQYKGCDSIIAYGSTSSNMCRAVANLCTAGEIPCYIINSCDKDKEQQATMNSRLVSLLGIKPVSCTKNEVKDTLEALFLRLKDEGKNPYYIYGDSSGHGNERTGMQAYRKVYRELTAWQQREKTAFDYIFLASGTGTTQAGLLWGQTEAKGSETIVGISVARSRETGINCINGMLEAAGVNSEKTMYFLDDYLEGGYGCKSQNIAKVIKEIFTGEGLFLDQTYTGKAFYGMNQYIKEQGLTKKNILFIHTGGTPLFFDSLQ